MDQLLKINAGPLYEWLSDRDHEITDQITADGIFVVGGAVCCADAAARLWKNLDRKLPILFTDNGGTFGANITHGENVSELYFRRLIDLGVPSQYIHVAPPNERSTNTALEAQAAGLFIKKVLPNFKNIIICSRNVHQRRAWATFSKYNPDITFWNYPTNEPLVPEFLLRMVQECDRLVLYAKQGNLIPQNFPDELKGILDVTRELVAKK